MIKRAFRCCNCETVFANPEIYYETHGLDCPPYERVAVCPKCKSDNYNSFDLAVEKSEVAERLLFSIAAFNRYCEVIKRAFGNSIENENFEEGYENLSEFICEMFSFITADAERKIFTLKNNNDIQNFLLYLKG